MLLCTPSPISCIPGWPQTFDVAKGDLELMIFLPLPSLCWDHSHTPSVPQSFTLDKQAVYQQNYATAPVGFCRESF